MYRIIKISLDVHSTNYTIYALEPVIGEKDRIPEDAQMVLDYREIFPDI